MIGTGASTGGPERRLVSCDRRVQGWLAVAVLAGVGATLALIAQLGAVALAVSGVLFDDRELADVLPLLWLAFSLLAARAGFGILGEVAARQSAYELVGTLRAALTGQLLRLGPVWADRERSGEIAGVLGGGLESIEDYLTTFLPARWLALIVPLLVLLIVLLLDPPSVLVLLFTGPLLILLLLVIGARTRAISERRFLEMRTLSAFFLDILRGIVTLKMFGRSHEQAANLQRISARYGDTTMEVLRTAFQTSLVLEWGATIAIALVAVEVGLRLLEGGIDFERALAVLLITPEFFLPLRSLAVRYHVGTAGTAAISRTFEILDQPAPASAPDPASAGSLTGAAPPALAGPPHLRFEGVGFGYPERELPALDDVWLEMQPGRSLALVGASGAGKSTAASLLLRFIDPVAGGILVDGLPLSAYPLPAWRASLSWVPQRPHLFAGTVADNIRLARPGADDHAIAAAAAAAGAASFIERLPGGYDAPIGEAGTRLSGGQRQRIAIARAFLRDAPLLILDEATSHQDELSEAAISEALERLLPGRTVLIIAHRSQLARRADQVVVLDRGQIVEAGSPAQLLAGDGAFHRLVDDAGDHW